ncbi:MULTISPECIES: translation initiation factor IF-2 subunit beta [unclassified Halorhabdus]|uniref:translation initiation factor IF-2 subunit beta n=1 Tax=unclassified Halorhabdus TaxID=2621901 RepID=UPI0023DCB06D|nr:MULTISPECIES: translation initiation factor IF-2 subunit beta [unclassified Halorhabdus]WEL16976.1 Translation initiation factor 2, beta subunit (eIF-2beta)/eIF-5 N-terminal domain [Halorhabdus sp. SVX81]WEL20855.1 Translation initiation factor 2, beta subunit (eIF-2beta)/eIF-5 N-terminal domain [Halorhabdus sp. BNX81]
MDYDDMLDRAIEDTPDIESGADRFDVPDPDVRQEGNMTVYENFQATTRRLGREDEHVMKFLQDELGTSGHIDESGRARLTGEFKQRRIQAALDAYTEEFVICSECGLPDTRLIREQGAILLRCEACGARSATSG